MRSSIFSSNSFCCKSTAVAGGFAGKAPPTSVYFPAGKTLVLFKLLPAGWAAATNDCYALAAAYGTPSRALVSFKPFFIWSNSFWRICSNYFYTLYSMIRCASKRLSCGTRGIFLGFNYWLFYLCTRSENMFPYSRLSPSLPISISFFWSNKVIKSLNILDNQKNIFYIIWMIP
jgi:hypothetical protein